LTFGCGSDGWLGHKEYVDGKFVYLYKESEPKKVLFPKEGWIIDYCSSYYFNVAVFD